VFQLVLHQASLLKGTAPDMPPFILLPNICFARTNKALMVPALAVDFLALLTERDATRLSVSVMNSRLEEISGQDLQTTS
jgi:hypothetical protein